MRIGRTMPGVAALAALALAVSGGAAFATGSPGSTTTTSKPKPAVKVTAPVTFTASALNCASGQTSQSVLVTLNNLAPGSSGVGYILDKNNTWYPGQPPNPGIPINIKKGVGTYVVSSLPPGDYSDGTRAVTYVTTVGESLAGSISFVVKKCDANPAPIVTAPPTKPVQTVVDGPNNDTVTPPVIVGVDYVCTEWSEGGHKKCNAYPAEGFALPEGAITEWPYVDTNTHQPPPACINLTENTKRDYATGTAVLTDNGNGTFNMTYTGKLKDVKNLCGKIKFGFSAASADPKYVGHGELNGTQAPQVGIPGSSGLFETKPGNQSVTVSNVAIPAGRWSSTDACTAWVQGDVWITQRGVRYHIGGTRPSLYMVTKAGCSKTPVVTPPAPKPPVKTPPAPKPTTPPVPASKPHVVTVVAPVFGQPAKGDTGF